MYRYTVRCRFNSGDMTLVERWLQWLRDTHIDDVLNAGATAAEIVRMSGDLPTYEIRYQFADEASFRLYERDHAPRLRAEGLSLFPLERGLEYSRTEGEVIFFRQPD